MNKSESINELAKALVGVQAILRPATKDAKNPFFKSNYASLNSVWDVCREPLTNNGLAVTQLNHFCENGVVVETVLMHTSGQWISGEIFLPLSKHDAQSVGSASSYGRRYGLASIIGIVADEDDDGNHASGKTKPQETKPQEAKPQDTLATERLAIKSLCQQLNKGGDTTKWTAAALNALFDGETTIETANAAELAEVKAYLVKRSQENK